MKASLPLQIEEPPDSLRQQDGMYSSLPFLFFFFLVYFNSDCLFTVYFVIFVSLLGNKMSLLAFRRINGGAGALRVPHGLPVPNQRRRIYFHNNPNQLYKYQLMNISFPATLGEW